MGNMVFTKLCKKKRYTLEATINEMNEQIDNIRKLNLIILEIKRIRTLDK